MREVGVIVGFLGLLLVLYSIPNELVLDIRIIFGLLLVIVGGYLQGKASDI